MLLTWKLGRFKSAVDQIELPLTPLTLFTGANSAGKSSIIQSILLTAQSVQSSQLERPVVLNGYMARLGSFSDLVSSSEPGQRITVGFELDFPSEMRFTKGGASRIWAQAYHPHLRATVNSVGAEFSFSATPCPNSSAADLLDLQPILDQSKIFVRLTDEDQKRFESLEIRRSQKSAKSKWEELGVDDSSRPRDAYTDALKYDVVKQAYLPSYRYSLAGLKVAVKPVGAVVHHFLPRAVAVQFDEVEARAQAQYSYLVSRAHYSRYPFGDRVNIPVTARGISAVENALDSVLPGRAAVGTKINSYFAKRALLGLKKFKISGLLRDLVSTYEHISSSDYSIIVSAIEANKTEILNAFKDQGEGRRDVELESLSEGLASGADYIQHFFSMGLKYLGPLRDEPKPVYPLAGTVDPADVGFKGEYTAAVLHTHRGTTIEYIPSAEFEKDDQPDRSVSTLFHAVTDWLAYMGVGSALATQDSGKLGHALKITTEDNGLSHDLTQVGVGVSQVLPIVVLALLAEKGSTLVFEQPELHLHPRVQSRLADFFVSMTMLGKQCIVETHSEYIVNRLRYRSVSDQGESVSKSVSIYFVEKFEGKSSYKRVSLDSLGALDSWPAGFFDEAELGMSALLRKSLEKRRALAKTNGKDAGGVNG